MIQIRNENLKKGGKDSNQLQIPLFFANDEADKKGNKQDPQ